MAPIIFTVRRHSVFIDATNACRGPTLGETSVPSTGVARSLQQERRVYCLILVPLGLMFIFFVQIKDVKEKVF